MKLTASSGKNVRTARVLIIEDEPIIALGIEDLLIDAGFQIAGVAARLEKALSLIESGTCDVAIVDANLARSMHHSDRFPRPGGGHSPAIRPAGWFFGTRLERV